MPELKFAKNRRLRRFETVDVKEKRIKFQRLTSDYPRRSWISLVVIVGIVAYLYYYLTSV